MATSKRLWVVEGPDGGGKSTLAASLVQATSARVVHLGPFPRVTKGLARMYLEAMLPALQGLADVVLDRSWLSEPVYAQARRRAASRLDVVDLRMLERVAARCRTTVVRCLPPLEVCAKAYAERKAIEYLRSERELKLVHLLYANGLATGLPTVDLDYTEQSGTTVGAIDDFPALTSTAPHPLGVVSAGHLDAPVLLVGDRFAEHKEYDALQQYPFVSFGEGGCSRWLTAQLERAQVPEHSLLWVNADQDIKLLLAAASNLKLIVALGEAAADAVVRSPLRDGVRVARVDHPQRARRFRHHARYELLDVFAEALP